MITQTEIETLAAQIVKADRERQELIYNLTDEDVRLVNVRAAEIACEIAAEACSEAAIARAEADQSVAFLRLARAAGCPDNIAVIPWLHERGLVERIDGRWRFKKAKPEAAAPAPAITPED
jgi:hypothetical protein